MLALPEERDEHWRRETALLQPILTPAYDPPPRHGPASRWDMPAAAYDHLPQVQLSLLAASLAQNV